VTAVAGAPEVLIVAGEASSALYAQRLLEHWRREQRPVHAFGVGSREMEALGFEIFGRSEDLAVVGLVEVLRHYRDIKSVFDRLVEAAHRRRPKVILLLDYPGFNLRLAQALKPLGIPIVYYISPQVWAWKKSRVWTIKRLADRVLCVLPFEQAFYRQYGMDVDFVGHPLLDEIDAALFDPERRAKLRAAHGFSASDLVLGLMPGSRSSEIRHHLQVQLQAAALLHAHHPTLKVALLVAPSLDLEHMRTLVADATIPLVLIKDDSLKMASLADLVLCASGTATLVVGLAHRPMVIMYRMNPVTARIARWIVRGAAHFGLVNLILDARVVPELFQEQATPEHLARELARYLDDEAYRARTQSALMTLEARLGAGGATARVAHILESYLS
jgi:lipid-A-disaccharide synthase